ncbi:G protein-regulated inducer of neurite outgrowth 1 [Chlamydotis macqueenii]
MGTILLILLAIVLLPAPRCPAGERRRRRQPASDEGCLGEGEDAPHDPPGQSQWGWGHAGCRDADGDGVCSSSPSADIPIKGMRILTLQGRRGTRLRVTVTPTHGTHAKGRGPTGRALCPAVTTLGAYGVVMLGGSLPHRSPPYRCPGGAVRGAVPPTPPPHACSQLLPPPRRSRAERDGTGRERAAGPAQGCLRHVPPLRQPQQRLDPAPSPAAPGEGWVLRPVVGLAWEKPSPGMGSAKEPEGLQRLRRQAGAEDACEPSASSPGCPPVSECLPGSGCAAEGRVMRTCCAAEPEAQGAVAGPAVEKMPSPTEPAPGTLLPDAGMEPSVTAATGSCEGPSGAAPACDPMGMGDPGAQKENAVPPMPEPCLKAPSKDTGSAPAPTKHVAFAEPAAGAGAAELPSQEQPQGGTGMSLGTAPRPGGSNAPKHPQGGMADPPSASTAGSGDRSEAGLSATTLGQGRAEGSPAQDVDAGSSQQPRTAKLLCESYSFEVTPPQDAGTQDMGTQVDNRASLVSVALSPMSPPGGAAAFTFPKREPGSVAPPRLEPSKKDAEMQVSMPVETRSVATGPMTPVAKSPQASYPEVHVKGAVAEEAPEPIREVSWDEKGMTWEVYGASMEVEVLGMAIQKHLEKQIEEHGRQVVTTPQSTRTGSIKGASRKGEAKRQPSVFRALLQNVRRPRCCSRAGPAME